MLAFVVVALLLLAPAARSQGSPSKICTSTTSSAFNKGITIKGGNTTATTAPLSDPCKANATADLGSRTTATQWVVTKAGKTDPCFEGVWGPYTTPVSFKTPTAAPSCNVEDWARYRIIQYGHYIVDQNYNYCHHHVPSWLPPTTGLYRVNCTSCPGCGCTSVPDCTCNEAGMGNAKPWQGVDCSNLSSFLYNIAFGAYFISGIDAQACNATTAPGRLLTTTLDESLFKPGDLLFITTCSTCQDVSHVVLWTGYTVDYTNATQWRAADYTLSNVSPCSRTNAANYMRDQQAAGLPTYLILDSTYNGPKFRPFAGWYRTSFSHARRVIAPSLSLPITDSAVFSYTSSPSSCKNLLKGTVAAATTTTTTSVKTSSSAACTTTVGAQQQQQQQQQQQPLVEFWADRGPKEDIPRGGVRRLRSLEV